MTLPPPTRREAVVEVVHGIEVADPYRWLEQGRDPEVEAWVARQNAHTRQALDADPSRRWWHERLVALMQLPVVAAAEIIGARLISLERFAGGEQFVLTGRAIASDAAAEDEPMVLFDPTSAAADATVAIDWFHPSADGSLVAVGVSEGGTEDSVLRVLDATSGRDLAESIPSTRACSLAWDPDGGGFHYTRYPEGDQYHRTVHYHRLGSDWRDDPVVWAEHESPQAWPSVEASPDGRWLLVSVQMGWSRVDVHLLDRATGSWSTVVAGEEATTRFTFATDGAHLVGITTVGAPRGRVVTAPLAAPGLERWTTLVAEGERVLGQLAVAGSQLLVSSTSRAVDVVERFGADGTPLGVVSGLGDVIAVTGLRADRDTGVGIAVVDAFDAPTRTWRITIDGTATPVVHTVRHGATSPDRPSADDGSVVPTLVVTQTTYRSTDGTEIGIFVIHRVDVQPAPDVPVILSGYGGFAISESPRWSPHIGAWCAGGGVYAVAGLRGGLEHGEAWHHAGRREYKQNVFDDFAAGADWLVSTGRASRERLAIFGRSNGGLLVGAAMTQRPDLCRAVWCGVPLLDMIRYPRFLIARLWTSEYGDPDVAEEFAWLRAYSPYHHVVEGTCYPATLFTTAQGDTRVDPLHARKMAASMQAASSCQHERPILLFQEGRAGHGVGKPVHKRADELADGLTFLSSQLGAVPA